jgi:hypothetical protein
MGIPQLGSFRLGLEPGADIGAGPIRLPARCRLTREVDIYSTL